MLEGKLSIKILQLFFEYNCSPQSLGSGELKLESVFAVLYFSQEPSLSQSTRFDPQIHRTDDIYLSIN